MVLPPSKWVRWRHASTAQARFTKPMDWHRWNPTYPVVTRCGRPPGMVVELSDEETPPGTVCRHCTKSEAPP